MVLFIYNTKNLVGLEINIDSTATEAWKFYKEENKVIRNQT